MKQEVNQHEEKFLQAFRTLNMEMLEELIHDELTYIDATGEVISKKADFERCKAANPKIEILDCIEREIQMFDDTAIVSTVIHLKGLFGEHQVEGKTRFLRIWKKFRNDWKIIGAASVNLNN
jgi:hypothetical protein